MRLIGLVWPVERPQRRFKCQFPYSNPRFRYFFIAAKFHEVSHFVMRNQEHSWVADLQHDVPGEGMYCGYS